MRCEVDGGIWMFDFGWLVLSDDLGWPISVCAWGYTNGCEDDLGNVEYIWRYPGN